MIERVREITTIILLLNFFSIFHTNHQVIQMYSRFHHSVRVFVIVVCMSLSLNFETHVLSESHEIHIQHSSLRS